MLSPNSLTWFQSITATDEYQVSKIQLMVVFGVGKEWKSVNSTRITSTMPEAIISVKFIRTDCVQTHGKSDGGKSVSRHPSGQDLNIYQTVNQCPYPWATRISWWDCKTAIISTNSQCRNLSVWCVRSVRGTSVVGRHKYPGHCTENPLLCKIIKG